MALTEELVRQVRAQIQENNEKGPVTDDVILDALNRGLDYGWDILARNYNSPILSKSEPVTLDANGEYELPDGIFEDRILKVDLLENGIHRELEIISHRDVNGLESPNYGGHPTSCILMGRTIRVLPRSSSTARTIVYWYLREIPKIVPSQGRIISFTAGDGLTNATVVVDDATAMTLDPASHFGKYLNFIDFETGEIRGSAQIQTINGNQLTLKLVPTRSKVLGQDISDDLPEGLEIDDYICGIEGSCVLYFGKPLANMLVQYAVTEIRRALGYDVGVEQRVLDNLENQVSYQFSKRPNIMRVKRGTARWRSWFRRR